MALREFARFMFATLARYWTSVRQQLDRAKTARRSRPLFVAGDLSAQTPSKRDFEAAKQEYEQSSRDEAARLTYVTKLAEIANLLVSEYRQGGQRHDELMTDINSELQKHPAPKDVNSKELSQLLVGKWESPRRTYVFRADGKWGNENGPVASNWRIQGNQMIEDGSPGTIILLNRDYFIYSGGHDAVFFHSRVKE
jgi:hypothetical protein